MQSLVLHKDMTVEDENLHHLREDILLWTVDNLHSHWCLRVVSQQSDAEQAMPEPITKEKLNRSTTGVAIRAYMRDGMIRYKIVRSWTEIVFDNEDERLLFKMRWL